VTVACASACVIRRPGLERIGRDQIPLSETGDGVAIAVKSFSRDESRNRQGLPASELNAPISAEHLRVADPAFVFYTARDRGRAGKTTTRGVGGGGGLNKKKKKQKKKKKKEGGGETLQKKKKKKKI